MKASFPRLRPSRADMTGRFVRLENADPKRHARALFEAYAEDQGGRIWTYLPYGPFTTEADFGSWMASECSGDDPMFFAICEAKTGKAIGLASYLRINPNAGSIEVGHLNFAPELSRTPHATEAMYLMMARAFDLGYRRYEWKCDALNAGSRRAAERLGFSFEGVHRQATHYKGRNRDTAWYSILDSEWPAVQQAFDAWLSTANFDADGTQRNTLQDLRVAQ